jgi:hypothetical protein
VCTSVFLGKGKIPYVIVLVSENRSKGAGRIRLELKDLPNAGHEYPRVLAV